jgi:ribosomal protein S18 acetylase RimI-like enzyme
MNGIIFRKVDTSNPKEMQAIAAIDMGIPTLFDSLFQVNEKTINERLEQLMKAKPDDFFQVAVDREDKIVGYHFMNKFKTPHGVFAADIQTLWVDPSARKKGIAKTLKANGEQWAKEQKLDHISTFVHGKNAPMLSLNQDLGFELVGYKLRKKIEL